MAEPEPLRRGKAFQKRIVATWSARWSGLSRAEVPMPRQGRRAGRADLCLDPERKDVFAIIEIKSSDWDSMRADRVRRNVARYAEQVLKYADSQTARGTDVCPAIVFERKPRRAGLAEAVEHAFNEHGVQVVWNEEDEWSA